MKRAYTYTSTVPVVRALLVGGGPYDGRTIDRRGDIPDEITLQWPQPQRLFGEPITGPRYCTYRRIGETSRFEFQGPKS
jgi:hypothetical protein